MGKDKYVAYVGTYSYGKSEGIQVYDVDAEEGTLSWNSSAVINNSSYVIKSTSGKYLYSVYDGGVAYFKICQKTGHLTLVDRVFIRAMRTCYLAIDRTGRYLFAAGYHDGKVTVININEDETLGDVFTGVFHKGLGSVSERNFRPHVSCVNSTPDGKYICAVDNGIDQVKIYRIDEKGRRLALVDVHRCRRESGPREIVFSADGKYAYFLFELGNRVGVFKYHDEGKLPYFELIQLVQTIDKIDVRHDCACAIIISEDGKYLYTSTAGNNSVTMFEIQEDGTLKYGFSLPISGEYPKDIALFPDGKHLAVVNHESNSITTFTINHEAKTLVMKGRPMKVETPNSIVFVKLSGEEE